MKLARSITKGSNNKLFPEDAPVHAWYRFVLSFPPHLVRGYLEHFKLSKDALVLDPFCGTGTTLVECKKHGIRSIGLEANPVAAFASRVKTDWNCNSEELLDHAEKVYSSTLRSFSRFDLAEIRTTSYDLVAGPLLQSVPELSAEAEDLLLTNSISILPKIKALCLLQTIRNKGISNFMDYELLCFAKALVHSYSNLNFGPEVGVGKLKGDTPVLAPWFEGMKAMAADLAELQDRKDVESAVHLSDSRDMEKTVPENGIDAVITSPPYPNEKDYTRTTRLENVFLGFLKTKSDLRALKQTLVRSNTRNVYINDKDSEYVRDFPEIQEIANEIERRRIELGKTSGFERLYAQVTRHYFGGMARHLTQLKQYLKPGAQLVYIVGDQASYFRVMIRTGKLLAQIATKLGYEVKEIQLFRSRLSTATREFIREEGVILQFPKRALINGFTPATMNEEQEDKPGALPNRYVQIIESIFRKHHHPGATEITFDRNEIEDAARTLGIELPKNLGDLIYSFRYRNKLPDSITRTAVEGKYWSIKPKGKSKYCFTLSSGDAEIKPRLLTVTTKIPDATPGMVVMYALDDEQALLARLRYNRLIDIATGITCYSLQNHLRTFIAGMGQVEADEIYVGVDRKGVHYVFPVEAKGGRDKLSMIQIEQNFALCASKFPDAVCKPIGAQFAEDGRIVLFEFEAGESGISIAAERHYELVAPTEVTPDLLESYRKRLPD